MPPPPHEPSPLLEARDLGRRLPADPELAAGDRPAPGGTAPASRWIFRHVELALGRGELLTVHGATGSGKTLLLRTLAGLDGLDEGRVLLLGRPQPDWEPSEYRRTAVYLHQSPALQPGTVEENLREPFGFTVHRDRAYDADRAAGLLRRLGRGPGFRGKSTENLSGGERQAVALTRALLLEPQVLLLDEPTAALDPDATRGVESTVVAWLEEHPDRGVLWVTHDAPQADRIAHRKLRLAGGRLEREGGDGPAPGGPPPDRDVGARPAAPREGEPE